MEYYDNAVDVHESAEVLYNNQKYRMSIYNVCLAAELYLKSRLQLVEHDTRLESSHDVIGIYRCLSSRFRSSKDLTQAINMCRKYFNETRYPYDGTGVFTAEFAKDFLDYLSDIRSYVDNECVATLEDLKKRFGDN